MMICTKTATAIAVVALLSQATACSDKSTPTPDPTPTASSSAPTSSPEPTQSATPQAETAEEFIRRWSDLEVAMINSGTTDDYRSITSECQPCAKLADRIEGFYAHGGFAKTAPATVKSVRKLSQSGKRIDFEVRRTSAPTEYRENRKDSVKRLNGGPALFQVTIRQTGEVWALLDIVEVAQ